MGENQLRLNQKRKNLKISFFFKWSEIKTRINMNQNPGKTYNEKLNYVEIINDEKETPKLSKLNLKRKIQTGQSEEVKAGLKVGR